MMVALPALLSACGADTPDSTAVSRRELRGSPEASGIQHVVLVMMENRSFDHFFGWVPGADGRQAGLSYTDRSGVAHSTYPLAPDYQGCSHPDPDHSYDGSRVDYDGGACDGWLRAGNNDSYAIGYYQQQDLGFFGRAVPRWTTFDRYFSALASETYPNRIYQHAAQTDRIENTLDVSTLPTIWDRLADKGVSGRYYYSDVPFLALWGAKYLPISRPLSAFLVDAWTGNLPAVSFVDPPFLGEEQGTSSDDHPHADVRRGELFLNLIYSAVTRGPDYGSSVLFVNYDEGGGFFAHVPPPTAPIPDADRAAGNEDGLLGFRTPSLLVAPWARSGFVSHQQFDPTSLLQLIEWRWDLEPLSVRDASAANLADALDFAQPFARAPSVPLTLSALEGLASFCTPGANADAHPLSDIAVLARNYGFAVYP